MATVWRQPTVRRLIRVAAGMLLALGLILPARAQVFAKHAAAALPVLREQYFGPPWIPSLDPAIAGDTPSIDLIYMVQANLVKYLPNGNPIPDLAHWKVSKNHRVYTFTLRKGAVFSNGDPVTAQDVKFSLTRALAKATGSGVASLYLGHILGAKKLEAGKTAVLQGVKVLNNRQVQITVDRPIAFFLEQLTFSTAEILDPKFVRGKKPGTYLTDTCAANVGAGPFKFVCRNNSTSVNSFYAPGQSPTITLVPNPRYYGPKPHIKVVLSEIANTQSEYRAFQAGQIDVTGVPPPDIAQVRNQPGFLEFPTSLVDFLTANEDRAPFNNVHCRLALTYALNRNVITNDILHGAESPLYEVLPKGMLGYYPGANLPHYNPAKARAELAQCPGGIHNVSLVLPNTSADLTNEYTAVVNMWQAVGIDIKLDAVAFEQFVKDWETHLNATGTDLLVNDWAEDYNDPQDYMTFLLHSGQPRDLGDFRNKTYDRLVDEAEVTFNKTKRVALYKQAQRIAIMQGAWIPIGQARAYVLIKPYVHGFVGSPLSPIFPRGMNWANITISKH